MFDGKNFSKILKRNDIKSIELSSKLEDLGVKLGKDAVDSYRKGVVQTPNLKALIHTAKMCNVTIIDFLEERNEIKKKITIQELKNNIDKYIEHIPNITLPPNIKKVLFNHGYPVTNKIVMENSMQNAEHIYIDKLMLSTEYQEEELRAIIMIGDAMSPYLEHGDVAIYHPSNSYSVKGKYVISSIDGLEVISIEKLKKCGSLVLKPENPIYTTETFSTKEQDIIEFVGLLVGRISKK
jgi:SOS-response transcriptional repressor LexA